MSRSIHTTFKSIRGLTKGELNKQVYDPDSDLRTLAKKSSIKEGVKKSRKIKKFVKKNLTESLPRIEIEQLKKNVFSDDWDLVKSSADKLGKIGGDEVVGFLISLLALENPGIRNRAALALEDIKDNRALEPLLTAIFKRENHNYNGTMVFALESLDCSKKLKEIFRILFYESYEAKISAHAILCEQKFEFTKQDLLDIQEIWEDCKLNPEKCPEFDESKEMIEDDVNGFMGYLKPQNKKTKNKR